MILTEYTNRAEAPKFAPYTELYTTIFIKLPVTQYQKKGGIQQTNCFFPFYSTHKSLECNKL